MSTVVCYDIYGTSHHVSTADMRFSPAAYGIFIENDQLLLIKNRQTALWQLPGGRLAAHETPTLAVRFFVRRVTGITPTLRGLVHIEDRFVLDEAQQAWRLSCLYYALQRPSAPTPAMYDMDGSTPATWLPLAQLQRESLQFGYKAIRAEWLPHRFRLDSH